MTSQSAAVPGCLHRDGVHGQVGRLLPRGPQTGAVLHRDSRFVAPTPLPKKHSARAFSPVFKGPGWSRGRVLAWLCNWYENRKEGVGVWSLSAVERDHGVGSRGFFQCVRE